MVLRKVGVKDMDKMSLPFDRYPLFLTPAMVKEILQVSYGTIYKLFKQDGFPSLRVGKRYVVPKDKFIQWVEDSIEGAKGGTHG